MSFSLQEGTVFAGRYRIVRCIAMGGMGAVYEVTHMETERRRALKVMLPHTLESAELRDRFKREAKVAAQIDSDFIVDVFDAGVDDATGMPFLVMELLKGEELGKRLARTGRMPPSEVVACLYQAALALDKTHQVSIVHRDLKPENLFLTQREHGEPRIKVLDFGIAKFIADHGTHANATRSLGTPLYMAPEQFRGVKISPAVDIYALGMMAYTLLVGDPYWETEIINAGSVFAFAMIAMDGPQEPPTQRAAKKGVTLPPAFDAWFIKTSAPDPSQRFATATATINALAEALGVGSPAMATPPAPGAPVSVSVSPTQKDALALGSDPTVGVVTRAPSDAPPRKRGPGLPVAVALGVVAIGAATFFILQGDKTPSPQANALPVASTTASAAPTAALPSAAPTAAVPSAALIESATVKVEPAGSAAPPGSTAASKPSSGPRKPSSSATPRATAKPGESEPVYTRD